MKAIVWTKYGTPDGLRLQEVGKPIPKEDEISGQNSRDKCYCWRL